MVFVSITRLRIRSIRYLPEFVMQTLGSLRQVRQALGFKGGKLLADRRWTFWTMTSWDCRESMRQYMTQGSHAKAMPHLMRWCDEASVVHWEQPEDGLPDWTLAEKRMRENGRASKVLFPSPQHANLSFQTPRQSIGGPIVPKLQ